LRVEDYFQQVRLFFETSPIVQLSKVSYDKRGRYEGFIRGELYFIDGSILHIREFVDVEITLDRLMYAYQYSNASQQLIFRYDNTGHHKKLGLPNYPHHKHQGSEENVVGSLAPNLLNVLEEIETLIQLP